MVQKLTEQTKDPDVAMPQWLEHGAPMGLAKSIEPGGLFPLRQTDNELDVDDLAEVDRWASNHPSFEHQGSASPGIALVQDYLEAGFVELFVDEVAASKKVGCAVHPAPLGLISKVKPDGSTKHRVIQDLQRNQVNAAVRLPERQVLPRPTDHAKDMALLSRNLGKHEVALVLILDFANAFMSIPLDADERPYNCTVVPAGLHRQREPLHDEEPERGRCLLWRVLGFGGRPNPLVYSRAASFAARTAQALLGTPNRRAQRGSGARGRLQLYVDDPVLTVAGPEKCAHEAVDLVVLWWLLLGVPLAWAKGQLLEADQSHTWIGVDFKMLPNGEASMKLPDKFVKELLELVAAFCSAKGHSARKDAMTLVGRAARVAHVIPEARPFATALWAALTSADRAQSENKRESPPGRVANVRFHSAARWLRALLQGGDDAPFLLERIISAAGPPAASMTRWAVVSDASPWGAGAVLLHNCVPVEFAVWKWDKESAADLDVKVGAPADQSFWEFFTVGLCIALWGKDFVAESLAVVTDNTAALQQLLDLKGKGPMLAVAMELSWRKARGRLAFEPGHLPSEQNRWADALSRLAAPKSAKVPEELRGVTERSPPAPAVFWKLR